MTNTNFSNHFKISVKSALARYKAAKGIDHLGLRGKIREILAEDLISPILPPGSAIGNGKIVDTRDNSSPECDIILYHRNILPPLLFDQRTGLFPIEACLYAIEIKSKLTATELDDTINKFQKLWSMKPMRQDTRPIPVLFAFETDLSGKQKTEFERYLEHDSNGLSQPIVPVICVVGSGYWFFNYPKKEWNYFPSRKDRQEVLDFIGGVANTISKEWVKRLQAPFGNYIIEEGRLISAINGTPQNNNNA